MKSTANKNNQGASPTSSSFFDVQKSDGNSFANNQTQNAPFFPVQTKLSVGSPNDKYEKEADATADKVVGDIQQKKNDSSSGAVAPAPHNIQHKCPDCQAKEQEEGLQMKADNIQTKPIFESDAESEGVQMKCAGCGTDMTVQKQEDGSGGSDSSGFEDRLNSSKGGGKSLPDDTRSSMENSMGADFSGVNVHDDSNAVQMNQELGSQAFASGNDIYFNENKYNPDSESGQHLLAHELTHTVQQGASPSTPGVQSKEAPATDAPIVKPTVALDITNGFRPDETYRAYLDANPKGVVIDVTIGNRYSGTVKVKQKKQKKGAEEGTASKYELSGKGQFLTVNGMSFLNPLKNNGVLPILVLKDFGEEQATTGFLSVKMGDKVVGDVIGLISGFNAKMTEMSFIGLDKFTVPGGEITNKFEQGRLVFNIPNLSTTIDGFLTASGEVGISGETFTFGLNTTVDVGGLASGEFSLNRAEDGSLNGEATIEATIANVVATLRVEYLAGAVTIQGTGRIDSDKFSGEINLLVTDKAKSKEIMHAALGVTALEGEADEPAKAPIKTPTNQVIVGWGEVTANITPWLAGNAKIGIDADGHVTIVGEITVPEDIILMEQMGKKIQLVDFEVRVGYGVPLVGQVFIFGGIGLFINAGFGPLVLKNVGFTGTYSTDPSVLQEFSITGALNLNAFAILGLEAEAGVGLTLLGHDIKAGINVTAAAGLKAYAEAQPTFEYKEKAGEQGGKVGEAYLKGHFEAAAQLFLALSGSFFVELDSPWWSPAPDDRWDYPLGEVEYPIGDSMGIGGDVDWLVGSPDPPELKFSPVEFDPEKFTADVMADPPPGKKGGDKDKAGKWDDGSGGGDKQEKPGVEKKGDGLEGRKKEDLSKLPDEEKYMRGLSEISDIAEKKGAMPQTVRVLDGKIKKIKKKYGLDQVKLDEINDDHAMVYVKHAKENNKKHMVKVPIMSEAQRIVLLAKGMAEFEALLKSKSGESGKLAKADADAIAKTIGKNHPVIELIRVVDGGDSWDFFMDIGDKNKQVPGKGKAEATQPTQDPNSKANDNMDPAEKAKKVKEGIAGLHKEEKKYLDSGKITKEEAEKVVVAVKLKFPIFTSLAIVDGKDSWDYRYSASPFKDEDGPRQNHMIDKLDNGSLSVEERKDLIQAVENIINNEKVMDNIFNSTLEGGPLVTLFNKIISEDLRDGYRLSANRRGNTEIVIPYYGLSMSKKGHVILGKLGGPGGRRTFGTAKIKSGNISLDFFVHANAKKIGVKDVGANMLDLAVEHFESTSTVAGIDGWWLEIPMYASVGGRSINLTKFIEAVDNNETYEEAAKATWTYQQVKRHGYTEVHPDIVVKKENNRIIEVKVVFIKPEITISNDND